MLTDAQILNAFNLARGDTKGEYLLRVGRLIEAASIGICREAERIACAKVATLVGYPHLMAYREAEDALALGQPALAAFGGSIGLADVGDINDPSRNWLRTDELDGGQPS